MILKKLSIVATLALGLTAFGCKSDCEKLCEDMMECDPEDLPLEWIPQDDDCSDDCEEEEEWVDAADCNDIYDDLMKCVDGLDVCDVDELNDSCGEEYIDLAECYADYCDYDRTDPDEVADAPGECD